MGVQLFVLALLGFAGGVVAVASFVPGFGLGAVFLIPAPIRWSRSIVRLVRRRTAELTGVSIGEPYKPPPAPPVPQPDGWYRRDRQLYRTARWPKFHDRLNWLLGDDATWRDLAWSLTAPISGGLVALMPVLLVGAGLVLPWLGYPVALILVLVGFLIGPAAVRHAAHLYRRMLGGPFFRADPTSTTHADRRPFRQALWNMGQPVVRLAVLFSLCLLGIPVAVATIVGFVLGYGLGLYFFVPWVLGDLRFLAQWRRALARWSGGRAIPSPYRPLPELVPDSEGLFRVGRNLYKTRRWAQFAQRHDWLFKDPATWREMLWRMVDPLVGGLIAGIPVVLVAYGIWGLILPRIVHTVFGLPGGDWYGALGGVTWPAIPVGLVLAVAGLRLAPWALRIHGRWTEVLLKPSAETVLVQRVEQLTQTRAEASAASASELRRIERDLHDGAQSRLVAVGMGLASVERLLDTDPQAARELLAKTRESAAAALRELREVVRGIHPPVLAERGLGDAVRAIALDSPLSTDVTVDLPGSLPDPVEAAAYFAVAEALGNAARHGHATSARIVLRLDGDVLRITVTDNGRGGADPDKGTGLRGLARRLGIFDGIVTISSPAGGPTQLTMEIPCASSSPRTSTS